MRASVHVCPLPVRLPARLSSAAIVLSGMRRARPRINASTSASVFQRCMPARFFVTQSSVWSPPYQCTLARALLRLHALRSPSISHAGSVYVSPRCGVIPSTIQIGTESQQAITFRLSYRLWATRVRRELLFNPSHLAEPLVPAPLKFSSYSRFSGSTVSYCQRAHETSKRACSKASSSCRRFASSSATRSSIAASAASTPIGFSKCNISAPTA